MVSRVDIYTDGGYSMDRNIGAWAIVVVDNGKIIEKHRKECTNETSQRMELRAFLAALKYQEKYDEVHIYSDSAYTLRGYNEWMPKWKSRGWIKGKKTIPKNIDLWKEIDKYSSDKIITHKVKAHSGNKFNEIADGLCKIGEEYKNHEPINQIYLTENGWEITKSNDVLCELQKQDYLGKMFVLTIYKDKTSVVVLKDKLEISRFEGVLDNILAFKKLMNLMKFEIK